MPQNLAALVAQHCTDFTAVLNLGCGTGLAAPALARFGGVLTGVDLSAGMLKRAEQRGYAVLAKEEAIAFLSRHDRSFDLVFAADMVIYLGPLAPLLSAAAGALVPSGILAFSTERAEQGTFSLRPSGRFAHAPAHLAELAGGAFDFLEQADTTLRSEGGVGVGGTLNVLRRR